MDAPPDPFAGPAPPAAQVRPARERAGGWAVVRLVVLALGTVFVGSAFVLGDGMLLIPALLGLGVVLWLVALAVAKVFDRSVVATLETMPYIPLIVLMVFLIPYLVVPLGAAAFIAAAGKRPIIRTVGATLLGLAAAFYALLLVVFALSPSDSVH